MKQKLFLLLSLAFLGFGTAKSQVNNIEWIISWSPMTPCANSPVTFTATDTSGQYLYPYYYWYVNGVSGYGQTFTTTFTAPGLYQGYFSGFDSLNWAIGDSIAFLVFVDSACGAADLVTGHAYNDDNGNGVQDGAEADRPYSMIELNPGPYYFSTDLNGDFSVYLPAGSWTLSGNPPNYWTVTQPAGNSYALTLTGTNQTFSGNDFGFAAIPNMNDLMVSLYAAPPVPGFQRNYYLHYQNLGTSTLSGTVQFIGDLQLTNGTSASGGGVITGNTTTWTFSNLAPGQWGNEGVYYTVPLGTVLGSTMTSYAVINPIVGDQAPNNNTDTLSQVVVASYDPNDKSVSPEGNILPGQNLDYRVRFQNTGTYYATNVVVRDELDSDLDVGTFQFIGSSHPCTWMVDQDVVTFTFNNIMLPDSNMNEPASHGFLRYTISAKAPLTEGTTIENTADIYFDFNPAIVTNTTVNTIDLSSATIDPHSGANATLFPNPFSEEAVIIVGNNISTPWTVTFYDLSGKAVMNAAGNGNEAVTIHRNGLTAGMYLYTVTSEGKALHSGKVIVN